MKKGLRKVFCCIWAIVILGLLFGTTQAGAQDSEDLAKKLANPVASLISVPIHFYH